MMVNLGTDWIYQQYVEELGNKLFPTDFYYNEQKVIK
jgi:hypothetical protein